MLTPEEEAELAALQAERQQRVEERRRNWVPSEEEKAEARRITGLEDASGLYKFNAGLMSSLEDVATAPKRITTELGAKVGLPGFEEKALKQEQQVDEKRRLMEMGGGATKAGGIVGDIATGFIPGFGVAAKLGKVGKLGAVGRTAVGGAAGGAAGGALNPLGTQDSGLLNLGIGALAGGVLGGGTAAAMKGIGKVRNAFSKDAKAQELFNKAVSEMDPETVKSFDTVVNKLIGASQKSFTPTEQIKLATIRSPSVSNYVKKLSQLSPESKQDEVKVLTELSQTFPMDKLTQKSSIGQLFQMYEGLVDDAARAETAPIYRQLAQETPPGALNKTVQNSPELNMVAKELSINPSIATQDRAALNTLLNKRYTQGDVMPSMATYNEMSVYLNDQIQKLKQALGKSGQVDQNRLNRLNAAKTQLDAYTQQNPLFAEATAKYAAAKEPLNKLRSSEAYRLFTGNKSDKTFSTKSKTPSNYSFSAGTDTRQLGTDIAEFNPNLYHNITAGKVNNVLDKFSTGEITPKTAVRDLARIESFAHESPDQSLLVNMLRNVIKDSTSPETIPLVSKLMNTRNIDALQEVFSNPNRYRAAIRKSFTSGDRNKNLGNLLNVLSGASGAAVTANDQSLAIPVLGTGASIGIGAATGVGNVAKKVGRIFEGDRSIRHLD